MKYCYKYEVTTRSVLEPWIIKTYLHSRGYNVLILLTKGLAIYRFSTDGFSFSIDTLLSFILFFYFEFFILYKYFHFKKRVNALYGSNNVREVIFTDDKILYKDVNATTEISVNEITKVKETRWFFFVYKGDKVIITHYKNIMNENDMIEIRKYYDRLPIKYNQ